MAWAANGSRPIRSGNIKVIEIKGVGFSEGYTLVDPDKREWSAKLPPEAHSEVVVIADSLGPRATISLRFTCSRNGMPNTPTPAGARLPARFREKNPDLNGLQDEGDWSYYENPFVGTRQLNGLLVLQVILGNSDLKDSNNALYQLKMPLEGAKQWYVARDLGQSFGRSGTMNAPRNDVEAFESYGVHPRHREWKSAVRLQRPAHAAFRQHHACRCTLDLRPAESADRSPVQEAFRAGGYEREIADRFIKKLRQKAAEGLALKG